MSNNLDATTQKIRGNKKAFFAIALILMMTLSTLMAGIPAANAAVTEWDTFAYLIITPEVVGVNQSLVVEYRIDKTVPIGSVLGPYWTGFTVKITKPDGTTETKGPLTADSTGGSWFAYTPTKVGTYSFQMSFPGQWINWTGGVPPGGFNYLAPFERWYKPSTSKTVQVTVQQDPIPTYPTTSLPADYWTRPIYGEIKGACKCRQLAYARLRLCCAHFFWHDYFRSLHLSSGNKPHNVDKTDNVRRYSWRTKW